MTEREILLQKIRDWYEDDTQGVEAAGKIFREVEDYLSGTPDKEEEIEIGI